MTNETQNEWRAGSAGASAGQGGAAARPQRRLHLPVDAETAGVCAAQRLPGARLRAALREIPPRNGQPRAHHPFLPTIHQRCTLVFFLVLSCCFVIGLLEGQASDL